MQKRREHKKHHTDIKFDKHLQRLRQINNDNASLHEDVTVTHLDVPDKKKRVKYKVKYNLDKKQHQRDHSLIDPVVNEFKKEKRHHRVASDDVKYKSKHLNKEKIGSADRNEDDIRKLSHERRIKRHPSSSSLKVHKSKKHSLRKEKTIHVDKDLDRLVMTKEEKLQQKLHKSKERKKGSIKDIPQQAMYCQVETKCPFIQEHVYPGEFYNDNLHREGKKRKRSASKDKMKHAQMTTPEREKESTKERKEHRHKRHGHSNVDDNKKIKELYVHTDKKKAKIKHRKHDTVQEPEAEVADELVKSYLSKIQAMIDRKLDALLNISKSKQKIERLNGKSKHKVTDQQTDERKPKSPSRHKESRHFYAPKNSISDSSITLNKHKVDTHQEAALRYKTSDREPVRRKSSSQERHHRHHHHAIDRNDFRVQGIIEPAALLQQPGAVPKKRPCSNFECKTISIVGIPSQMQERSVMLNHTQTSTSLKCNRDNSEDEFVEKKKKTKRFKLYYKYSLDDNTCVSSNSSDAQSLASDSCRVILAPSDDENDISGRLDKQRSPVRQDRTRVLKKNNVIKDRSFRLNNILEERSNSMSNEKSLQSSHSDHRLKSKSHDREKRQSSNRKSEEDKTVWCRWSRKEHRHKRKRSDENKFISKSDTDISYISLHHKYRKNRSRPEEFETVNSIDLLKEKLKSNHDEKMANSVELISQTACKYIMNTLKEISKEYKQKLNQNHHEMMIAKGIHEPNIDTFKCCEEFERLKLPPQMYHHVMNKINVIGKDNTTQTSLSLNVVLMDKGEASVDVPKTSDFNEQVTTINDAAIEVNPLLQQKSLRQPNVECQRMAPSIENKLKHVSTLHTHIPIGVETCDQPSFLDNKKLQKQLKKSTEKKPVIYKYKKYGKIAKRDTINNSTETKPRTVIAKPSKKSVHCIALNTSFDRIEKHCVGLNTSFVEDAPQRSSVEECDSSIPIIRVSKSETSLLSQPQSINEGSKVASLTCLHKADEDKFTFSTKSNALSLDRYGARLLLGDQAHTSRLFLTKDYKTQNVPAYQRRKSYDESIRRKLRRKPQQSDRQFAQQIFEVRFLHVDDVPAEKKKSSPIKVDEACSPINLHNNDSSSELPIYKQVPPKYFERALVRSLREELFDRKLPYRLDIKNVEHSSRTSFTMSDERNTDEIKEKRHNFCGQKICEVCEQEKLLNDLDLDATNTSDSRFSLKEEKFSDELYTLLEKNIWRIPKRVAMNNYISCPVLNHVDSSFDFLYETDSTGKPNDTPTKKPTILGYALKSETALSRILEKVSSLHKLEQTSERASLSEESGYSSRKSCCSFFKQPLIAGLLKPASNMDIHPNGLDIYEAMSKQCREYASKVRMNSSKTTVKAVISKQELPSDLCLTLPDGSDEQSLNNSNKEYEIQAISESKMSLASIDTENDKFLFLEEILDKKLVLSSTNFNSLLVTFVDHEKDVKYQKGSNEVSMVVNEHSDRISQISIDRRSDKRKHIIIKNFFENLLEVYEKEICICSMLYQDEEFFKNDLLDSVVRNNIPHKTTQRRNTFVQKIKTVLRKMFRVRKYDVIEEKGQEEECTSNPSNDKYELLDVEHDRKLQALAKSTRKYFSMFVEAVKINQDINDEIKTCGLLRLLEMIENGQIKILRQKEIVDHEEVIREQVKESFIDMYKMAEKKAREFNRTLSEQDARLLCALVSKYRMGLLSTKDLIVSCIGRGILNTDEQLKDAVTYLIRIPNNNKLDLEEFENFCSSNLQKAKSLN